MSKRIIFVSLLFGCALIFLAGGIYAGTAVKDEFPLQEDYEHKKGIVIFSHKKHAVDYAEKWPEFYPNGCGDCHHDAEGKPLKDLKDGDDVQKCIECHKKPGERPKGKDAPKLSKKERLEYHAEAYHYNCTGCHKAYNKKYKTKAAPATCTKCHPKTKK